MLLVLQFTLYITSENTDVIEHVFVFFNFYKNLR